ncbi:LPS export ABC transporter periplasmic protein LptC [Flavobacterium sp.]|jgi:LPS export ABC transporter protein LptC|uniref:LPS export ABC transporter periplasmic protein LptC n=1 Tax=Flavobacterium sp. TaxID=239 RepID=UPI002608638E|nr:LPS export ABC transporter periplasmic protein LptC [Flavobacterium sp.]
MQKWGSVLFGMLVLISILACEGNFREVQKSVFSEFNPSGDADSIHIKYTDSGKIKSVLISPKMLDYATVKYPFTEFPKGLQVTLYDAQGKPTFVTAKYGVRFKDSDMIDLQGSVKITNTSGQVFETEQLYFDQKNEWFFTEKRYKFSDPKGVSQGEGVDFSKDLKIINSQRVSGIVDQVQ